MEVPVLDYAKRNPHAGYDGLVQRFGTPERIVESCLDDMDTQEVVQHLIIRKKIVAVVASAAMVMVVLWVGAVCIALTDEQSSTNGIIVEELDVIERIPISNEGE